MCKHYVTVVLNLWVLWLATSILNMIDSQTPSQGVDSSFKKIQKPIVHKNFQIKKNRFNDQKQFQVVYEANQDSSL